MLGRIGTRIYLSKTSKGGYAGLKAVHFELILFGFSDPPLFGIPVSITVVLNVLLVAYSLLRGVPIVAETLMAIKDRPAGSRSDMDHSRGLATPLGVLLTDVSVVTYFCLFYVRLL